MRERRPRPGGPGQPRPGESRQAARAGRSGWYSPRAVERAPRCGAVPAAGRARVGRGWADCGGHVATSAAAVASASWAAAAAACAGRTGPFPSLGRALPLPPPGSPRRGVGAWGRRGATPGSAGAHPRRLDARRGASALQLPPRCSLRLPPSRTR